MKSIFRSDTKSTTIEMIQCNVQQSTAIVEFELKQTAPLPSKFAVVSIATEDEAITVRSMIGSNGLTERLRFRFTGDGIEIAGKTYTPRQIREALDSLNV